MRKLLSLSLLCLVLAVGFPLQALAGGDGGDLQPSFRDVNRSHWFYEPVTIMAERGLISGDGDGAFRPNDTITVAEFVKVLVSAMGHVMVPAKAGFWAEPFLQKAAELGVMQPEAFDDVRRPITRGEMAGMIVRAAEAEAGDDSRLALDLPDALSAYALWITDYGQLSKAEQDDALRVFASGIMSGFPDGRIGFDQPATRAEACAMLLRLMEQERRIPPAWPMTAELRDTWSVKSFTTELLAAIGEEASMERAVEWGIVRPETDYPSHDKPILRREAALTIARLLDRLTGYTALFTTGDNRYFLEGRTLNHRVQPMDADRLVNQTDARYVTLLEWEKFAGHIADSRMLTPEYRKEMMTLYLAGIIDADENGRLRPYDFLTPKEAQVWIGRVANVAGSRQEDVVASLAVGIRDLPKKAEPAPEAPANAELWGTISPYVNKRLYEYPVELHNLYEEFPEWNDKYNAEIYNERYIKVFPQMHKNVFHTLYTVDYRLLEQTAPVHSPYCQTEIEGTYRDRFLFFHNPAHVYNHEERDRSKWILPDHKADAAIDGIRKHRIVSQAEFVTDRSLTYRSGLDISRGTLRIIFYPPTDPAFLRQYGMEVGRWYEVDLEIQMAHSMDGPEELRDRWTFSLLNTPFIEALGDIRPMDMLGHRS